LLCAASVSVAAPVTKASVALAGEATSNNNIPCVIWKNPAKPTKAAMLLVHGLSLHKNTYAAFGKRLADEGIVAYAIDVRGFGDWVYKKKQRKLDFQATLGDIRATLERIHKEVPGVPVFILGESMGGGLAVQATAKNPDLIDGLISSCPASERYHQGAYNVKVALHALTSGFHSPMKLDKIVDQATDKDDLRKTWENDPEARMTLSPVDLHAFQTCMEQNVVSAKKITKTPVLFVQGAQDKLVRAAGTWKLFEHIASPQREQVFSKSDEHLIFEETQFGDDDFKYVLNWIDKTIAAKQGENTVAVATKSDTTTASPTVEAEKEKPKPAPVIGLDYWIELHRGNSTYRCTNKSAFRTGDKISFHVIPHEDGYAYIMLTTGSSGRQAILFPSQDTGLDNHLKKNKDYILPTRTPLLFDKTPGIERVSIVFSKIPIDAQSYLHKSRMQQGLIAYISPDRSGAKDLVPTRMQLSWDDDSSQLISPDEAASQANQRLVRLSDNGGSGILAVDIALEHN
jgi:alpha-beta hydrolase superfamily lysophospholipase